MKCIFANLHKQPWKDIFFLLQKRMWSGWHHRDTQVGATTSTASSARFRLAIGFFVQGSGAPLCPWPWLT